MKELTLVSFVRCSRCQSEVVLHPQTFGCHHKSLNPFNPGLHPFNRAHPFNPFNPVPMVGDRFCTYCYVVSGRAIGLEVDSSTNVGHRA